MTQNPEEEERLNFLYRCRRDSDCPTGLGLKCMGNVWIQCDTCVAATWKLKGKADGTATRLFDLASNPEEDERLNFLFQNCNGGVSTPPSMPGIAGVITALEGDPANKNDPSGGNLKGWVGCVGDPTCLTPY